jgi:energy-coupling factor transport system permease protein
MKCRGYSLKGRTAFSIYRFDNRDRSFVVSIFLLLTLVGVGWLLNQTDMYYDPQLIINKITAVSYIFYISYAILLLLPMILQISGEWKYDKLVAKKL